MRKLSFALALIAVSGCINDVDVSVDMGVAADASIAADMTLVPDASLEVDASLVPDAAVLVDASAPLDAALDASLDATIVPDAAPDATTLSVLGDACGDATAPVTTIGTAVVTGSIDDFTHNADTSFRCNYTGPDAFFEFVAGDAGLYTFEVSGAFDVALRIFEDTCGGMPIECSDEEGGTDAESVGLEADAGQHFFVFIDSLAPSSPTGSFSVDVAYEDSL